MKNLLIGILLVVVVIGVYVFLNRPGVAAGPYGGDLVALDDSKYAEVLANDDSGELMAHVWENDLRTPHPIANEPLTIGSGENSVRLIPHPTPGDPAGTCSRFYGQANWVRGGGFQDGWLHMSGDAQHRHRFAWNHSWRGGQSHDEMWREMQGHRMGQGGHMGPGMRN